jgi:hypothetical protein
MFALPPAVARAPMPEAGASVSPGRSMEARRIVCDYATKRLPRR